jgi:hypothetical protein
METTRSKEVVLHQMKGLHRERARQLIGRTRLHQIKGWGMDTAVLFDDRKFI